MNCPSCQHGCPPEFRFCSQCGTALERVLDEILGAEIFDEYLAYSH